MFVVTFWECWKDGKMKIFYKQTGPVLSRSKVRQQINCSRKTPVLLLKVRLRLVEDHKEGKQSIPFKKQQF